MRTFLFLLIFTSILHAEKKPNIILFLIDDMGVMDCSVPFLTDENGKAVTHPLNKLDSRPMVETK